MLTLSKESRECTTPDFFFLKSPDSVVSCQGLKKNLKDLLLCFFQFTPTEKIVSASNKREESLLYETFTYIIFSLGLFRTVLKENQKKKPSNALFFPLSFQWVCGNFLATLHLYLGRCSCYVGGPKRSVISFVQEHLLDEGLGYKKMTGKCQYKL